MVSPIPSLLPYRRIGLIFKEITKQRNQVLICLLSFRICSSLASSKALWKQQGLPWWSSALDSNTFTAGGTGFIPGWGTKIPHTAWCSQKKKKEEATTATLRSNLLVCFNFGLQNSFYYKWLLLLFMREFLNKISLKYLQQQFFLDFKDPAVSLPCLYSKLQKCKYNRKYPHVLITLCIVYFLPH